LASWVSLVGVGFHLGYLGAIGIRIGASILKTFWAAPSEATSPILIVLVGLRQRISLELTFGLG